jgi:hypothetical protein
VGNLWAICIVGATTELAIALRSLSESTLTATPDGRNGGTQWTNMCGGFHHKEEEFLEEYLGTVGRSAARAQKTPKPA